MFSLLPIIHQGNAAVASGVSGVGQSGNGFEETLMAESASLGRVAGRTPGRETALPQDGKEVAVQNMTPESVGGGEDLKAGLSALGLLPVDRIPVREQAPSVKFSRGGKAVGEMEMAIGQNMAQPAPQWLFNPAVPPVSSVLVMPVAVAQVSSELSGRVATTVAQAPTGHSSQWPVTEGITAFAAPDVRLSGPGLQGTTSPDSAAQAEPTGPSGPGRQVSPSPELVLAMDHMAGEPVAPEVPFVRAGGEVRNPMPPEPALPSASMPGGAVAPELSSAGIRFVQAAAEVRNSVPLGSASPADPIPGGAGATEVSSVKIQVIRTTGEVLEPMPSASVLTTDKTSDRVVPEVAGIKAQFAWPVGEGRESVTSGPELPPVGTPSAPVSPQLATLNEQIGQSDRQGRLPLSLESVLLAGDGNKTGVLPGLGGMKVQFPSLVGERQGAVVRTDLLSGVVGAMSSGSSGEAAVAQVAPPSGPVLLDGRFLSAGIDRKSAAPVAAPAAAQVSSGSGPSMSVALADNLAPVADPRLADNRGSQTAAVPASAPVDPAIFARMASPVARVKSGEFELPAHSADSSHVQMEFPAMTVGTNSSGIGESGRMLNQTPLNSAAAPPMPMVEGRIVDQVVGLVTMSHSNGETSMSMTLHPKELGEVRVELVSAKEGLRAHLHTPSQMVQEVLERHLPRLREAFEAQGVKLNELQVSCDERRGGGNAAFQRREQGQPFRYLAADSVPVVAQPETGRLEGPGTMLSGWSAAQGFSLRV